MRMTMGVLVCLAALSLAACSSDRGARALEGAGIGGAAGAVGTAVVGGHVLAGAAVGAAAGAVVGAVTDESDIDLKK
jgi:osmotically inducible lipoprotein OsmB